MLNVYHLISTGNEMYSKKTKRTKRKNKDVELSGLLALCGVPTGETMRRSPLDSDPSESRRGWVWK